MEQAFLERLTGSCAARARGALTPTTTSPAVKATVCIPTYNGGELLLRVVERVRSQRTPWNFEIVVVDSSSTDGSIERLELEQCNAERPLRVLKIPKKKFQHGRTRNLCANIANGEFVVFLTQDALPTDEFWLYNLTTLLDRSPGAAGSFGRHIPWPSASPFTKREVTDHFINLARHPLVLSRDTNPSRWEAGDREWRQILHFFSDNNSCLRRSVWEQVPYPEVDYGEDQIWADRIIRLGYEKVYAPSATVFHSHDHSLEEAHTRAATEAFFFATAFNYWIYERDRSFAQQLAEMRDGHSRWAAAEGVDKQQLEQQLNLDRAILSGRKLGIDRAACLAPPNAVFSSPHLAFRRDW